MKRKNICLIIAITIIISLIIFGSLYFYTIYCNKNHDSINSSRQNENINLNVKTKQSHNKQNITINTNEENIINTNADDLNKNDLQNKNAVKNSESLFNNIDYNNISQEELRLDTANFLQESYNSSDFSTMKQFIDSNVTDSFNDNEKDLANNFAYRMFYYRNSPEAINAMETVRTFISLNQLSDITTTYEYIEYNINVTYHMVSAGQEVGVPPSESDITITQRVKLLANGKIASIIDQD